MACFHLSFKVGEFLPPNFPKFSQFWQFFNAQFCLIHFFSVSWLCQYMIFFAVAQLSMSECEKKPYLWSYNVTGQPLLKHSAQSCWAGALCSNKEKKKREIKTTRKHFSFKTRANHVNHAHGILHAHLQSGAQIHGGIRTVLRSSEALHTITSIHLQKFETVEFTFSHTLNKRCK